MLLFIPIRYLLTFFVIQQPVAVMIVTCAYKKLKLPVHSAEAETIIVPLTNIRIF